MSRKATTGMGKRRAIFSQPSPLILEWLSELAENNSGAISKLRNRKNESLPSKNRAA